MGHGPSPCQIHDAGYMLSEQKQALWLLSSTQYSTHSVTFCTRLTRLYTVRVPGPKHMTGLTGTCFQNPKQADQIELIISYHIDLNPKTNGQWLPRKPQSRYSSKLFYIDIDLLPIHALLPEGHGQNDLIPEFPKIVRPASGHRPRTWSEHMLNFPTSYDKMTYIIEHIIYIYIIQIANYKTIRPIPPLSLAIGWEPNPNHKLSQSQS